MNLDDEIGILYVDDEEQSLKYFSKHFGEELGPIFVAEDAEQGLDIFLENQDKIGIVLSDKIMPRVGGYEFLEKVRSIDDSPLRMMVTVNNDLPEAVDALNDGLIYTYLTKPWQPEELKRRLLLAKDRFWIIREKRKLLKTRDIAFQKMLMAERVSNWETLAKGLNHYIRKAIVEIQTFFDLIPRQVKKIIEIPSDGASFESYCQSIDNQIAQVLSLLDEIDRGILVQNEGASSLELSSFDLVEIIKEIGSAETAKEPDIKFRYDGPDQIDFEADEKKVMRLFSGLTQEAKRRIGDGKGEIEVLAQVEQKDKESSPVVSIKYFDNGVVLEEGDRQKLFNPFHVCSDRPSEFDVTLLVCYFITYFHGGTIQADLENGRNFVNLTLPISS